jgi:hypothetical protein
MRGAKKHVGFFATMLVYQYEKRFPVEPTKMTPRPGTTILTSYQ